MTTWGTSIPLQQKWSRRRAAADGAESFTDCTLALYRWRRFPYLDLGLPEQGSSRGWEGARAAQVFFDLHARSVVQSV